jgi:hypothetical protein
MAYRYDPTGEKARAAAPAAPTPARNGKGDAYLYCRGCRREAAGPKWTRDRARSDAPLAELYGRAPSSYDWSRTPVRRRGTQAMNRRQRGDWPAPATVSALYGSWAAARLDALNG